MTAQPPSPGITPEQLVALALGEVTGHEAALLTQTIASSPALASRFNALQGIIQTLATDDSVAPPVELVRTLKMRLATPEASSLAAWLASLKQSLASIVFDSRNQATVAGFRGGSTGEAVQLAYASEQAQIDLQLSPPESGDRSGVWTIRGQVDPSVSTAGAELLLASLSPADPAEVSRANTDENGMFSMTAPAGEYTLYLRTHDCLITMSNIRLP